MKAAEIRNFVVAGHSGSGKTSLCEQILFKAKAIDRPGSVDAKNTVSDYTPDEHDKLSSIYASLLNCKWQDKHLFFIDTPGYSEFVGEVVGGVGVAGGVLQVGKRICPPGVEPARNH